MDVIGCDVQDARIVIVFHRSTRNQDKDKLVGTNQIGGLKEEDRERGLEWINFLRGSS